MIGTRRWTLQRATRVAFVLLIAAAVAPLVLQSFRSETGPSIEIVDAGGGVRSISLSEMKTMTVLTRAGSYQNQYGNWRDAGIYSGVLLMDLIGEASYAAIEIVADDGYRVTVERRRVKDADYPMVLAFGKDGIEVPAWEDGFRIAVLPEDGSVSNVDYGVESAGGYWVMRIVRLLLHPST
jgi:hypothetical protein